MNKNTKNTQINTNKSTHGEMGPVWQNPIQSNLAARSMQLSALFQTCSVSGTVNCSLRKWAVWCRVQCERVGTVQNPDTRVPDGSAPVYDASRTGYITTKTEGILNHRSRIRYLSKKNSRIFDEFSETKKIRKNSYKKSLNARVGVAFQWNSLLICIISNKPTTTTEEFDAFHGFMLIKI